MSTATRYTYHERTVTELRCACGAFWSYRWYDPAQGVDLKKCGACGTVWFNGAATRGNGNGHGKEGRKENDDG